MKRVFGVRALVAAPLLALACFTISASGAGAASPTGTRVMAPKPLIPRGATQLGAVSPSATVTGAVVLQPRDESALKHFLSQITDRKSPLFHQYLTPDAFASRFGPAPASIAAVKSQLQADGLEITSVDRDGLIVHFNAPASRVESTFRTGLERYRLSNGSIAQARTGALRVPTTIAKYVTSVVGLDTTMRLHPSGLRRAPRSKIGTYPAAKTASFVHAAGTPTPCSDATDAATEFGGLTDDQIANAYGAFGLYDNGDTGVGQSVAIFELEPFATDDIQTFDECYFGATEAADMIGRLNTIPVDGGQPVGPGEGEATLDVQDVSAFAPGANIDVYEAPNNTAGSFDQYAAIVNANQDQILTTSWGLCEQAEQEGSPGVQQAENLLFEQAAAQGMTVFSAAGDNGSNDCNAFRTEEPVDPVLSVDDPSSQPYVVAAGGTTIDNATQPPSEHVWNDGAAWGSAGGGISESWTAPNWQLNPLVPGGIGDTGNQDTVNEAESFEGTNFCLDDSNAGGDESACRQLPDVSAQSDEFTGAITIFVGELGFGWTTIGGTSSAAPMWAGMLADVNESPECQDNGLPNGVGFANPLLYQVAANPTAYAASFNDITQGNNDQYGVGSPEPLYPATTGYDMASGLGTPQLTAPGGGDGLAFWLCDYAASVDTPLPTVSNVSPAAGFTGGATPSVTLTGSHFQDAGNPVVGVQIGGFSVPVFHVTNGSTLTATFPSADKLVSPNDQTDGAGRYQVTVTLENGATSAPNASSWFSYVDDNGSAQPLPTVTGVHAYAGPDAGGNTVEIFGSGFTGVTGAAGVKFGGRNATSYTVDSDWKITATVPAFQNGVTTCDQDGSSFGGGEDATNDICQTQVVVTNPNGSSDTSTILPLYEGAISFSAHGVIPAPPGEEAAPAATEYDYVPAPHITSISTDAGDPFSLASEEGGAVVTIEGSGFNLAGLVAVNFGDPDNEFSQNFFNLLEVTGTEIVIAAPPTDITTTLSSLPVSVTTLSSPSLSTPSNSVDAFYAGIPEVDGVFATSGSTAGTNAGPDTGGTPIEIDGQGFDQAIGPILFSDNFSGFSFGTQYNYDVNDDTDVTTNTVAQNPSVVDVQLCTVTDCSFPTSLDGDPSDVFLLFPPGDPKIDSIAPASGPETGGTEVTITGENLGCVTSISFGSTEAEDFTNQEALLDCGSTNTVTVTAPAHAVGTVPVTLSTVESDATGADPASTSFTYTASPVLTVAKAGAGSGTVASAPGGINCGPTCSHKFAPGTSVTLTATAAAGSVFSGWSGGGCSGTGTCTVTTNSDTTVTATFGVTPPSSQTLSVTTAGTGLGSVTSSPSGISCSTSCSAQFATGTVVTLTATPSSGSTFIGWTGACSGTGTCTVTMSSNTVVTAAFNTKPAPTPKPKQCVVPNVKGKTLSAAKRALKSRHCGTGKVSHAFSGKVKKGRVISQRPKAGKHLRNGAKVSLVVSKGKKH